MALARKVDEEGDAVGTADEGEWQVGRVSAYVDGVSGVDQTLHERVIGEATLECAIRED